MKIMKKFYSNKPLVQPNNKPKMYKLQLILQYIGYGSTATYGCMLVTVNIQVTTTGGKKIAATFYTEQ